MLVRIVNFIANRYFLTVAVFIVWMLFFDSHNLSRQHRLTSTLNDLKDDKAYYEKEIVKDRKAQEELLTNTETLEKYGRENYLMKRENEDIYLIVRK